MLQSMGLQRVRHNWMTEQQQQQVIAPTGNTELGSYNPLTVVFSSTHQY